MIRTVSLVALACVLSAPSVASAWTDAGWCAPPRVSPSSGVVPANLAVFVVHPGAADLGTLTLSRVDGAEEIALEVTSREVEGATLITPVTPLEPGAQLALRIAGCEDEPNERWHFAYEIGRDVPMPTSLGAVRLSELRRRDAGDHRRFFVDATLVPDPAMRPWLATHRVHFVAESEGPSIDLGTAWGANAETARPVRVACGSGVAPGATIAAPGALTVRARAEPLVDGRAREVSASTTTVCDQAVDVTPGREPQPSCAVARGNAPGASWIATVLALGVAWVARRHRRA